MGLAKAFLFTRISRYEPSKSFLIGTFNFLPDNVLGTSSILIISSGKNLADIEFLILSFIFSVSFLIIQCLALKPKKASCYSLYLSTPSRRPGYLELLIVTLLLDKLQRIPTLGLFCLL